METKSVAVKEPTVPTPSVNELVSNVDTKANLKQTAPSESKKSAKSEKKQGVVVNTALLVGFCC